MIDPESAPDRNATADQFPGSSVPESPNALHAGQPDGLHNLFEAAGTDPEDPLAGLRNDPNYSALIRELEYIAQQARALFEPAQEEPADKVWDELSRKIQVELPPGPLTGDPKDL